MEIAFQKDSSKKEPISFTILENKMNGITGDSKEEIEEIVLREQKDLRSHIEIVKEEWEETSYLSTVKDRMEEEIKRRNRMIKNPEKKIKDSLKIVGLKVSLLERNINTLSSSEKKLLQLSISLLFNPDVLILEEPFKYLDLKNEKNIILLLRKIIEEYQKTIIIISEDSEILYKYTNHIIMTYRNKIVLEGDTKESYQKIEILKKNKIDIPKIIEFTNIAKTKKQVKIDYHVDIRDIIKDIYKHI